MKDERMYVKQGFQVYITLLSALACSLNQIVDFFANRIKNLNIIKKATPFRRGPFAKEVKKTLRHFIKKCSESASHGHAFGPSSPPWYLVIMESRSCAQKA